MTAGGVSAGFTGPLPRVRSPGHFMRSLITGVTGFVGGHLADRLAAGPGHTLFGVGRSGRWPAALTHLASSVELHPADLTDASHVERLLRLTEPDHLYHLAGYANTGGSFKEPDACWQANLTATRMLLDAVANVGRPCRVLMVSSGLIYGDPDAPGRACDEFTTLKPASPYAASKAAADLLAYQYTRSPGLDIVRVRLFNQVGPRQGAEYAVPNFARQIAAAEAGRAAPAITTGDLSAHRDLTDVRDMVAAFPLLLERGVNGQAYNAGRGETVAIRDVLHRLVAQARVPVTVHETVDPGRQADTAVTRADAGKLRALTGWLPAIPLDQSLADILADWRSRPAA